MSSPDPTPDGPLDEWLERREIELGRQRNDVGGDAARAYARLHGLLGRLAPWPWRRKAGRASLQLVESLGRLSEVREVRRGLLGLSANALIRSRATPNFVADNPEYAKTVEDETRVEGA